MEEDVMHVTDSVYNMIWSRVRPRRAVQPKETLERAASSIMLLDSQRMHFICDEINGSYSVECTSEVQNAKLTLVQRAAVGQTQGFVKRFLESSTG